MNYKIWKNSNTTPAAVAGYSKALRQSILSCDPTEEKQLQKFRMCFVELATGEKLGADVLVACLRLGFLPVQSMATVETEFLRMVEYRR